MVGTDPTAFGDAEHRVQVGHSIAPIDAETHLPPERTETPPPPASTVPFRRDANFVNRPELEQLEQKLVTTGARVAVLGLGGTGKSQLVIEYCYRLREQSPTTWVLWVHARNAARFAQSLKDIADAIKIRGRNKPTADIFKLVHDWLFDSRNKWTIVLDSADDVSYLFKPPGDAARDDGESDVVKWLIDYLPVCAHGSVIVTTRSREVARRLVAEDDIILVYPMGTDLSLALFYSKLGVQDDAIATAAMKLVAALEFMPLAITQAAAYIKQRIPRMSVQHYLEKFEKNERSSLRLLMFNVADLRRDRQAENSIIQAWQISFENVFQSRRSAAELLSLMSFFDHQGIPVSLLQAQYDRVAPSGRDEDAATDSESNISDFFWYEEDIATLRDYMLISITPDNKTFEIHRLVQLATRMWLESQGQYRRWEERSIEILDTAIPEGSYENWATCRVLFPHAKAMVNLRPESQKACLQQASIFYKAASYALYQGALLDAGVLAQSSLTLRQRILGDDNQATLQSLSVLASVYGNQERWTEAEKLDVRHLEISRKLLGNTHPSTLMSMANLATVYGHSERWVEAEELNTQVVEESRSILGREHPSTLTSMANLATVYMHQGRWEEAKELEVWIAETKKKVLGESHPDTLTSLANIVSIYQSQSRWEEARELALHVNEAKRRVLGEEHPSTLVSARNLAAIYQNMGRLTEAERLQTAAHRASSRVLGQDHPDTLQSVRELAAIYAAQSKTVETADARKDDSDSESGSDNYSDSEGSSPSLTYSDSAASSRASFSNNQTEIFLRFTNLLTPSDLVEIYAHALSTMERPGFLKAVAKALSTLCRELESEASSSLERDATSFLRSKTRRHRIAVEIDEKLKLFSSAPTGLAVHTTTRQWNYSLPYTSEWVKSSVPVPLPPDHLEQLEQNSTGRVSDANEVDQSTHIFDVQNKTDPVVAWDALSDNDDSEDDDTLSGQQAVALDQAESFIRRSKAFCSYKENTQRAMKPLGTAPEESQGGEGIIVLEVSVVQDDPGTFDHPVICSLEGLFSDSVLEVDGLLNHHSLWAQFEILASAVLDYQQSSYQFDIVPLEPYGVLLHRMKQPSAIFAKLAPRAKDSGPVALQHRNKWSLAKVASDLAFPTGSSHCEVVWRLGAVLLELLTFALMGTSGLKQFRTLTADSLVKDGAQSKIPVSELLPRVSQWLRRLPRVDPRAQEIAVEIEKMLRVTSERPEIGEVVNALQMSSSCQFWDGDRIMRFTRSECIPRLSIADRCKEMVEGILCSRVHWWPLRNGQRSCPASMMRLSWDWCKKELSVDVSILAAEGFRSSCLPLSQVWRPQNALPSSVPTVNAAQAQGAGPAAQNMQAQNAQSQNKQSQNKQSQNTQSQNTQSQNTQSGTAYTESHAPASSGQQMTGPSTSSPRTNTGTQQQPASPPCRIYWCIDGCWQQPKRIRRSVINANTDDQAFFTRLVEEYHKSRGLRGRFFSLRRCVEVEFIQFAPISSGQAEICRIREQLPPKNSPCAVCTPHCAHIYDFEMNPSHNDEIHRAVAATEIIVGMNDPSQTNKKSDIRRKVPAHRIETTPSSDPDPGWGIHAVQGWDQCKVLSWLVFFAVVNVLFVVFWLAFIDKTDLENAFTVPTFLVTMMALALALPQFLDGS